MVEKLVLNNQDKKKIKQLIEVLEWSKITVQKKGRFVRHQLIGKIAQGDNVFYSKLYQILTGKSAGTRIESLLLNNTNVVIQKLKKAIE